MSWSIKQKLYERYQQEEQPKRSQSGDRLEVALAFPNTYHVGMSNLGFQVIYREINSRVGTLCDRFFYPDKADLVDHERTEMPLLSLERQKVLSSYNIVAFAVSFEMDYLHLLAMLKLGRVPIWSKERKNKDPFVVVGGPCATFNPEPLAEFVDAFVIGEGEEVIHEILAVYENGQQEGLSRDEVLLEIASVPGVYVPRFYQPVYGTAGIIERFDCLEAVPEHVERRWIKNIGHHPAETTVVTENTEFKDMYLIEIARGCGRHCRFCMAGYCFRRPRVQPFSVLEQAIDRAQKYRNKVGLVGAAISDYPEIDELCAMILKKKMTLSVASLRADTLTPALAAMLARSGQRTITLAPEAGSTKLRQVINKGISNDDLERAMDLAVQAKIPHVRFYIMVGLPFEQDEDIEAIITLARYMKAKMDQSQSNGKLTLSINPFVPKPFTPFQWLPMTPMKIVEDRLKKIKESLRGDRRIEVLIESPKEAYIQGILARGDRRLAQPLVHCLEKGNLKALKKGLEQAGLNEDFYLYRSREFGECLPWHVLDMGLNPGYLEQELEKSRRLQATEPCREGCHRCGVCIEGESHE